MEHCMKYFRRSRSHTRHWQQIALSLTTVLLSCSVLAQTTGTGATVLQNGPTISPQVLSNVRYADQFSGADLGIQISNAVASLGSAGGVVKIPRGTYTWSTAITIDPRTVSIQGDGSPFVTINSAACTATPISPVAPCLLLTEGLSYSLAQGGSVSGFTMVGNGAANQVGVEAGGVIGEQFEDLAFANFNGAGAVALRFNNSASGNGWMERTITRKLRFDNNLTGLAFQYNTANPAAESFGYTDLDVQCDTVNSGQTCIAVNSGELYHSRIAVFADVSAGGTLISVPGTTSGVDQMWSNAYQILAEGSGTGISVGSGAEFNGYGIVDLGGMAVTNANAPTFGGSVRVIQGPTSVVNGDAGSFPNFLGTGNAATVYPVLVRDIGTPVAGYGFLMGSNIQSAYVALYNGAPNAFEVLGCPFNPADMGGCSSVARIDTGGNVHAAGAFYANGSDYAESVRVVGPSVRYQPGDILVIDPGTESRFSLSGSAYSTSVAGIYSTKPGVLGSSNAMGTTLGEEIPLAIHGIVPCKVSTENGPIGPGDLLVSASTPGYAMKGTDRDRMLGAVIGKSLGNLQQGTGVVSVLITLQ